MEQIISIITEDGVAMFKQIDIANIQDEINTLLLIKTEDDMEHLGIFCTYDKKWQSINLKATHKDYITFIKRNKIKKFTKKCNRYATAIKPFWRKNRLYCT